jgi:glucosamine--fructose-6-phosphate aminotransferase (isomerizing)
MCGIVGATAHSEVVDVIVNGLRTLEYRGYDSAGIATQNLADISVRKETGKISSLEKSIAARPISGTCAIGHTRWATHGKPSQENAHPHLSGNSIAVVHNGIIENSVELRKMLEKGGYHFVSETDSEAIPHLIHFYLSEGDGFSQACRKAISLLEGSYAIAITCIHEPGKIIAARKGSPLVVGKSGEGYLIASDPVALPEQTSDFFFLEEGDIAEITADSCKFYDVHGLQVTRAISHTSDTRETVSKGTFSSFMHKEIFEQPAAIRATLKGRLKNGKVTHELFYKGDADTLRQAENIHIVACGTSLHAGQVAKYWLESISRIPCHVEIASEYRYRKPVVPKNTLFICISQSGETADTLAALRFAKSAGYLSTLGICNVKNSSLDRESDITILTKAGTEIGVASTKALTTQLAVLGLVTLKIAEQKEQPAELLSSLAQELAELPNVLERALELEPMIKKMAKTISKHKHALFLGRGHHYPIAMEGALKLKEISYIHAEAYAAGELKHGPLALVDENMPVIAVCPNDDLLEKLASNIEEVKARGAQLHVLANHKCDEQIKLGTKSTIEFTGCGEFTSPIAFNLPLQMLAYHSAAILGNDVDQPRNLAKSVTVE